MNTQIHYYIFVLLVLSACQWGKPPTLEEVRVQVKGNYCLSGKKDYRLVLEDSTYVSERWSPGLLNPEEKIIRESCQGKYELVLEEDTWMIYFIKDPMPQSVFHDCETSYPIWASGEGYLMKEKAPYLRDLFDGEELVKGECGGL